MELQHLLTIKRQFFYNERERAEQDYPCRAPTYC
jgi:hypothetical protein